MNFIITELLFDIRIFSIILILFGILWVLGKGQGVMRLVDKKKFIEVKQEIAEKLEKRADLSFFNKFSLYSDKYLFIYLYYRNDLVIYWTVCGGLALFIISSYLEEAL